MIYDTCLSSGETRAQETGEVEVLDQQQLSNQGNSHLPANDSFSVDSASTVRMGTRVFLMSQGLELMEGMEYMILPFLEDTAKLTNSIDMKSETLVHSTLEPCDDADFTFTVFFNMKEHIVYVKKRPHLDTFLERVAEMFEIVIFTATQSIYATQLLDILDADKKLISRWVFCESCIFSYGTYTKDLTVLGVDLAKVTIIDNSPQVFRLQVNNEIPIKSWFNDPSDSDLLSLLPFLETLADADDVRPTIARRFGNKE
ncbi:CTD small phosphatase-like protein 2 [Linum perenne]